MSPKIADEAGKQTNHAGVITPGSTEGLLDGDNVLPTSAPGFKSFAGPTTPNLVTEPKGAHERRFGGSTLLLLLNQGLTIKPKGEGLFDLFDNNDKVNFWIGRFELLGDTLGLVV